MSDWAAIMYVLGSVYMGGFLIFAAVDMLTLGPVRESYLKRGGMSGFVVLLLFIVWPFLLAYGLWKQSP